MAKFSHWKLFIAGTALGLGLAGCGSSGDSFVATDGMGTSSFTITEPVALERNGDAVDSVELEAFDAQGNKLQIGAVSGQRTDYDPVILPFGTTMNFPALPEGTASVELDYLRNGGYTLFRATLDASPGGGFVANPSEQPADASTSQWRLEDDGTAGFDLSVIPTIAGQQGEATDFIIKGVCYSPTPINVLGDGAPNIGDFFFDNVVNANNPNQVDFFNWFGLWGKGDLGDGFFARQDIEKMRDDLKANTIRTYSMLSRQQNDPSTHPELPEFPDPNGQYHFQHKQFLDRCWNNGDDPMYVIVGIPTPADLLYQDLQANSPAKVAFYDFVLRETIADLADHPAVLGFTIQNEVNDGRNAFPGPSGQMAADNINTGEQNNRSDFYWGKVKEHSDYANSVAPDKLVGMVVHDFREIAQYASNFPSPQNSYLEQASNLDFVGINTYQTANYNDQYDNGWGAVTGAARKALLFSELGFPATTREGSDPATIMETSESRQNTADLVERMLPQAYSNPISIGACYFEFSDEWWKQVENSRQVVVNGRTQTVRAVDQWYGGNAASGFPNGYWDEEGFGLYSIARYPGLANDAPVVNRFGPERKLDTLTERKEITSVVRAVFESLSL